MLLIFANIIIVPIMPIMVNKYLDYNGLKYLWGKINDKTEVLSQEIVNISASSNRGGGVNTTFTVTVDGKATNYEYNGVPITLKINDGKTYTVTAADIEGYKTPAPVTYMAVSGNKRDIILEYKGAQLTVNIVGLADTSGVIIDASIDNNHITFSHGESKLIPYGSNVVLDPPIVEGYIEPDIISIICESDTTVDITYTEEIFNVFIMDAKGNMVDPNSWTGGSNATGVVLTNGKIATVVAPEEWYSPDDGVKWFEDGAYGGDSVVYVSSEVDFGGPYYSTTNNTQGLPLARTDPKSGRDHSWDLVDVSPRKTGTHIKTGVTSKGSPAALYAWGYHHGYFQEDHDWEIPSYPEMERVLDNIDIINDAMSKIGGQLLGKTHLVDENINTTNTHQWGYIEHTPYCVSTPPTNDSSIFVGWMKRDENMYGVMSTSIGGRPKIGAVRLTKTYLL